MQCTNSLDQTEMTTWRCFFKMWNLVKKTSLRSRRMLTSPILGLAQDQYYVLNFPPRYDLMSIMHYAATAFSKNGEPTIQAGFVSIEERL